MVEIQHTGSLFYLPQNGDEAAAITTNGVIRKNGNAVLGKGQALEAKKLVPGLEHQLGEYLRRYGNRAFYMGVHRVGERLTSLVTFPTKHHYRDNSDLDLIAESALQVKEIASKFQLTKVYLPPVGCGLGNLDYEKQVRPVLHQILDDDRFVVVLGYKGSEENQNRTDEVN